MKIRRGVNSRQEIWRNLESRNGITKRAMHKNFSAKQETRNYHETLY